MYFRDTEDFSWLALRTNFVPFFWGGGGGFFIRFVEILLYDYFTVECDLCTVSSLQLLL